MVFTTGKPSPEDTWHFLGVAALGVIGMDVWGPVALGQPQMWLAALETGKH